MTVEEVKILIQKRIMSLKASDSELCEMRWDMTKSNLERMAARDASNEVTARRHELEDLLKTIEAITQLNTKP